MPDAHRSRLRRLGALAGDPVNIAVLLSCVNHMGVNGARVLLALYLLELGAGPVAVGLLASMFSICHALLAVPIGRLIDRWGARPPMMAASGFGFLGMVLPYFVPGIPAIFAGAILVSLSSAIYNVSTQNLVGLLSTPENRTRNFSNYSLGSAVASFAGPVIAGFSIDHVGHALACVVIGLSFALSMAIVLCGWHATFNVGSSQKKHRIGRFGDLLAGRGMRRTMLVGGMQNVADVLLQFYLPVYCHSVGLSASVIGMVLGMNAAAAFVVRVLLPGLIRRLGEAKLMAYAFYLAATALVIIPAFETAVPLGMLAFCFGLGSGCTGPIVTMLMFANAPEGRSGEALGLKVMINHATKVVSPVLLGSVITLAGLGSVFWITAALMGWAGRISHKSPGDGPNEATADS